jgi:peptide/nickel transport system permease protein
MIAIVSKRLLYTVLVVLTVVSVTFALLHLSGDPIDALAPPGSDPADVERLREKYGLDQNLAFQYVTYMQNAATGDFGNSWRTDEPAIHSISARLPATMELVGAAFLIALFVAVPVGTVAGSKPGGVAEKLAVTIAVAGQAVPAFWLGTLLILVFAVRLQWLPSSGREGIESLILPAMTLAAFPVATMVRLVRSSVGEIVGADFVRTAHAKGLSDGTILWVHIFRNAALPLIAYAGVAGAFLYAGAVVVEWVFAYPGIGQLALQSVASRDLPVVQAFVIVTTTLIVLTNMLADLAAFALDPRIRSGDGAIRGAPV